MLLRLVRCFVVLPLLSAAAVSRAETRSYALVIGNNAPPSEKADALESLRYADDDAVRFYRFFRHMTAESRLFTVADAETQRRFPEIAPVAEVPTLTNIREAAVRLGRQIETDRQAGHTTVAYIVFSGHGIYAENGEPMLVLMDGFMTQRVLYEEILGHLKADFQHLFIDACYAEGVVGMRGFLGREVDLQTTSLTPSERRVIASNRMSRFPGLGVFVSSSAVGETHEWSHIQSGIFSHEVLSGLSGPADVNHDGKIVYSELYAFVSAANRGINDSRGRIEVIARPPARDQNAPIVDLAAFRDMSLLFGDPSSLRHFFIELENGERYLEANLAEMSYSHIALPGSGIAYLRTGEMEARIELQAGATRNFSELQLKTNETKSKGSIEAAFSEGLFSLAYSVAYYRGFIDTSGLVPVSFDVAPLHLEKRIDPVSQKKPNRRKAPAIAGFTIAGVAAVSTALFASLSLKAKGDFDETALQRNASEANHRYVIFGNAAWISGVFIPVGVAVGLILWPYKSRDKKSRRVGLDVQPLTNSLLLHVTF